MSESQCSSASNMAEPQAMFPIIIDKTIVLKLLQLEDGFKLFDLVHKNRHYLRQWLPWLDTVQKSEDQEAFIRAANQQWEERKALSLGIWHQQQLTGVIGFNTFDWECSTATIGYWLDGAQQGQGIITQACQALIDVAFQQLGLTSLTIQCATENYKSQAIPLRLGFVWHKTIPNKEWLYDRYVDYHVYLLKRAQSA